jgi:predicted nucleotidyltransferase/DNA-binding XRE family transcriptional regulator
VILRRARRRAGLTQVELAAKAGMTQSVISAYESGRRQPSLPTLEALVEAAGFDLTIGLRRSSDRRGQLTGPLGQRVRRHRAALVAAAQTHGVSNLRVFGSVARGEEGPGSDIDLLADLPAEMGLFGLGRLRADLEAIIEARVDLIPASDLKPDVRTRIAEELIAL